MYFAPYLYESRKVLPHKIPDIIFLDRNDAFGVARKLIYEQYFSKEKQILMNNIRTRPNEMVLIKSHEFKICKIELVDDHFYKCHLQDQILKKIKQEKAMCSF